MQGAAVHFLLCLCIVVTMDVIALGKGILIMFRIATISVVLETWSVFFPDSQGT